MNLPAYGYPFETPASDRGQQSRERLKEYLQQLVNVLETHPPEQWWRATYVFLKQTQRSLQMLDPLVADYLHDRLQDVLAVLMEYKAPLKNQHEATAKDYASAAANLIHDIAERMTPEREQGDPLLVYRRPISELIEKHPNQLRSEERREPDGSYRRILFVRADEKTPWQEIPLPNRAGVFFKGGPARMLLKIAIGHKPAILRKEFPLNDIDVIVQKDDLEGDKEATRLGADPAGIERVDNVKDMDHILRTRDIDLNQCVVDGEYLIFSDGAQRAAKNGCITICSEDRVLYGAESFYYDGELLVKNRGLQRLIKFVAEGKAESFCFSPLNEHVDFGVYWLVLARKFAKKANAGVLMHRLFELGKRCNQVYPGENNIYDTLDRIHQENPFFTVESKELDDIGLVSWLVSKLGKTVDRDFRRHQRIEMDLKIQRSYGDNRPYTVHLYDFEADPVVEQEIVNNWPAFVKRCHERTRREQEKEEMYRE